MDEADKYKQRLEAIAEKRRLQEEQDRARREMEDEKLRLQQLKRKSLRDQWLMEGAPLSPTSPDTQSPRSPLWGSQAQEMEEHIKLQSESQRLAEEEEKLKEQMEESQTEAVSVAEAGAEIARDAVVLNGENNAAGLETTEGEVKTIVNETAAALTNGGEDIEADTNPNASEQSNQSTNNGPVVTSEGVISMKLEPGSSQEMSETKPDQLPNVNINEDEEEEGTLMIRAERVIITDEGDDAPEDLTPQEDQWETMQSEETPLPDREAGQEGEEAVEEVVKTEAAPETFTQPEMIEGSEPTTEAQPPTAEGDMLGVEKTNQNEDVETKAEGLNNQSEDPASMQVQSPSNALEGTAVASVPVYSQAALTPELQAESSDATSPEGAEAALKAHDPAILPGQFQEVPLADPQEIRRTEAGPGEQEPLLSQAKTPETHTEPAAAYSPASTETQSPTRAGQREEAEAPKRKTCQCCSVM